MAQELDPEASVREFASVAAGAAARMAAQLATLPDNKRVSGMFNFLCMLRQEILRNPDTRPLADIMAFAMDRADRIKDQQGYEDGLRAIDEYWTALKLGG